MSDHAETPTDAGRVVAIWRYPVKSMLGEELNAVEVTARGLQGDRAHALIDPETGKVVSAKNPRRWPGLFDFRASLTGDAPDPDQPPRARVTFPDGTTLATDAPEIDRRLSEAVGRPVRLAAVPPEGAHAEGYWPDAEWLDHRDEEFSFELPPGTFFDAALVHLVTTATLDRLRAEAPGSRFEARRFRPSFVIATPDGTPGFVEDTWIGRTLALGDAVRLYVTGPCPRCVMTTLPQGDLPRDPSVLRTAVQSNQGNIGVYAAVERVGRVRRGDVVRVE